MNHYQTLGVGHNATQEEIKKAYRSLAAKYHPDRGGDTAKFQEIQAAYDVLGDEQKRAEYDTPQPQLHQGPGGFHFDFGPGGFEQFFSQGSPFGDIFGFQHRRAPVNRTIQLQTSINLEDSFWGKELIANVGLPSGKEQTVNIKIPRGIHEGTTLRLSSMGDDSIAGIPRGDILLTVHINAHPRFRRQQDDLLTEVEINCIDAMLGTVVGVDSIDGKHLETSIPAGTQHDSILSLNGYGMPNFHDPSRRGRLLLKIKIKIPDLTEDQKNNLKKLNI